jgi:hypothetical protein
VFCLSRREEPPREYLLSRADLGIWSLVPITVEGRGRRWERARSNDCPGIGVAEDRQRRRGKFEEEVASVW